MPSSIIVVERQLLESAAFRGLSGTAKTVLFDFRMKCKIGGPKKQRVIINNGELEYTYSEAEKKGIKRPAFMRAVDQLVERGFIDVTRSGSGGRKGDKSLYAISERWRAFGTAEFKSATRPKDTRQGRGWAVYWRKKKSDIGIRNDNPTIVENDNRN